MEPTSGNTGVGLALVAPAARLPVRVRLPDKVGEDKRNVLTAYGAEVVVTPTAVAPDSPESYYSVSDRLAREIPGAFKPNQYSNPNGPRSHYETTGPEIWRDTDGKVTHFVAGVGTGGTITGTGRYLREVSGDPVRIIGADPEGSVYSGGTGRPYLVEGVGEDFWPSAYDPAVPHEIIAVSDAESFAMTRRLAREEGILVGGSSGMAVVAALKAAASAGPDDVFVVLLPDGGRGYLGKIFNDKWMRAYGFSNAPGRPHDRRPPRRQGRPHRAARLRAPERHRARGDRPHDRDRRLAAARALRRAARRARRGARRPARGAAARPRVLGAGEAHRQGRGRHRRAAAAHRGQRARGIRSLRVLRPPAMLVTDGGKALGVITRTDLLTYLSA